MKRVVLFLVAATIVCVPSASAAGKADTRVTLDNIQSFPSGGIHTIWSGDIFSPKKGCKNERMVFVYRVLDGPDEERGSTPSYKGSAQPGYYWLYQEEGTPPEGDYYAKVRPTDGCKGDRSRSSRSNYRAGADCSSNESLRRFSSKAANRARLSCFAWKAAIGGPPHAAVMSLEPTLRGLRAITLVHVEG